MSLTPNKREIEEKIGIFFTNRYNKKYNSDYKLRIDPEDKDIDCIMESKINNKNIWLQLTTYDSKKLETIWKFYKNYKEWQIICINPDRVECIKIALKKKNNGIKNDHTLLIWSNGLIWFNSNWVKNETKNDVIESNYKKIYLVKMPNNWIPKNEWNKWEIIELK